MYPQTQNNRNKTILIAALLNAASLAVLIGGPFLAFGWWIKQGDNASGGLVMIPFLLILLRVMIFAPFFIVRTYLRSKGIPEATKIALIGALCNFVPFPFFLASIGGIYLGNYLSLRSSAPPRQSL